MPLFDFPKASQAPRIIQALDAPCGPLAAWGVLQHFHRWTSAKRLIKSCGHSRNHGVFAIALAVALHEHSVYVEFYSEPDPTPHPLETLFHQRATELDICRHASPDLETILSLVSPDCIPIILYNTDSDAGHFSPVVGVDGNLVFLPHTDERHMQKAELEERWSAPCILRQCILVRQFK
jgi:hypothetical protein